MSNSTVQIGPRAPMPLLVVSSSPSAQESRPASLAAVVPRNRAESRAQKKNKQREFARRKRRLLSHEEIAARARSAIGAPAPVQESPWLTLQGSVQVVKNVLGLLGSFGLPGAEASTCPVDGACNGQDAALSSHMSLISLSEMVAGRFEMERSPSLRSRKDQTLRGVVLLVADTGHEDPAIQHEIASLVKASIRPGDRLLIESPDPVAIKDWCLDVDELGAQCHGIDVSPARTKLDQAIRKECVALARIVRFALGKTLVWAVQDAKPSIEDLADLGSDRLRELVNDHVIQMQRDGESKFSAQQLSKLETLHAEAHEAGQAFAALLEATFPLRDQAFLEQIEHHAADHRAIFVVLGALHVDNLKAQLLGSRDLVVLRPFAQG